MQNPASQNLNKGKLLQLPIDDPKVIWSVLDIFDNQCTVVDLTEILSIGKCSQYIYSWCWLPTSMHFYAVYAFWLLRLFKCIIEYKRTCFVFSLWSNIRLLKLYFVFGSLGKMYLQYCGIYFSWVFWKRSEKSWTKLIWENNYFINPKYHIETSYLWAKSIKMYYQNLLSQWRYSYIKMHKRGKGVKYLAYFSAPTLWVVPNLN